MTLLLRTGQKHRQAKYDGAHKPDPQEHVGGDGGAYRGAGLFEFVVHGANVLPGFAEDRNDQVDHQQVEQNKHPFEDEAEKPALWFSQWVPAIRAIKGFLRHAVAAAWAINRCHQIHSPEIPQSLSGFACRVQGRLWRLGGTLLERRDPLC